ncbi:MAG: hypothetical protein M1269_04610 [Chloroflexi bacterium]|nr:hypothetical protein [Chloroflexota bacterium]
MEPGFHRKKIREFAARYFQVKLLEGLMAGLFFSSLLLLAYLIMIWNFRLPLSHKFLFLALLPLFPGIIPAFLERPSTLAMARKVDERASLEDRFCTALETAERRRPPNPVETAQLKDTALALEGIRAVSIFPFHLPAVSRGLIATIPVILLILAAHFFVPPVQDKQVSPMAAGLARAADELDSRFAGEKKSPPIGNASGELRRLAQKLKSGPESSTAASELNSMEHKLAGESRARAELFRKLEKSIQHLEKNEIKLTETELASMSGKTGPEMRAPLLSALEALKNDNINNAASILKRLAMMLKKEEKALEDAHNRLASLRNGTNSANPETSDPRTDTGGGIEKTGGKTTTPLSGKAKRELAEAYRRMTKAPRQKDESISRESGNLGFYLDKQRKAEEAVERAYIPPEYSYLVKSYFKSIAPPENGKRKEE